MSTYKECNLYKFCLEEATDQIEYEEIELDDGTTTSLKEYLENKGEAVNKVIEDLADRMFESEYLINMDLVHDLFNEIVEDYVEE